MDHPDNIEDRRVHRREASIHQLTQLPAHSLRTLLSSTSSDLSGMARPTPAPLYSYYPDSHPSTSNFKSIDPIHVPAATSAHIGTFRVSESARQAELMGSSASLSKQMPAGNNKAAMKDRFEKLFRQREDIQKEMELIKEKLIQSEYEALVKDIEKPQLATLKRI